MNILASELKAALRKLAPVKTETFQLSPYDISAQDSEVWSFSKIALPELDGWFNVNGKKLTQCVTRMSGEIAITREGNKLVLKSARAKVELEIQPIKPAKIPDPPKRFIKFKAEEFKQALSVAAASAGTRKSQEFGDVVQVKSLPIGIEELEPKGYRVAGTDGQLLAVVTNEAELPGEFSWLVGLATAEAVRLMDGDEIEVGETGTNLYFKSGNSVVISAKVSRVFKDYDRFFAMEFPIRHEFKTEAFASALRTVEPMIDEEVDNGAVHLIFQQNIAIMRTLSVGSTAEDGFDLEGDDPFGPEVEFSIKAKNLSTFLSKAGPASVISMADSTKPVKLESQNVRFLSLTTPLRKRHE